MANRDIVAIGAPAGGVDAIQFLASGIARGFPASIFIVLHLPSEFRLQSRQRGRSVGPALGLDMSGRPRNTRDQRYEPTRWRKKQDFRAL
jgi:hypothetical protein